MKGLFKEWLPMRSFEVNEYKYSIGLMRIKNAAVANKVYKKWFPLKVQ